MFETVLLLFVMLRYEASEINALRNVQTVQEVAFLIYSAVLRSFLRQDDKEKNYRLG
jgi:hypothetical protein